MEWCARSRVRETALAHGSELQVGQPMEASRRAATGDAVGSEKLHQLCHSNTFQRSVAVHSLIDMPPGGYINVLTGERTSTLTRSYYCVQIPVYECNSSCTFDYPPNAKTVRLHGQWVSYSEFAKFQRTAFLELPRPRVIKPSFIVARIAPPICIHQPVWSHRRRRSITSKTRQ